MQPEFPSDQTEQTDQHERRNRVAALFSRFQFLRHTRQETPAHQVRVIGNARGVIGQDTLTILPEIMRDFYGYEGDITIVTKQRERKQLDQ